jgi:Flp pilus assembly pilin Flp
MEGLVMKLLRRFVGDEIGTTAVEYSVMLGFIMLVLIGAVATFGLGQSSKWGGIWGVMRMHGM